MNAAKLRIALSTVAALVAGAYLLRQTGISEVLSSAGAERPFLMVGGLVKLVALVIAALFSTRVTFRLGGDNPAYNAWYLLSLGLISFATGQAILTWFQWTTGKSPFPSPADVAFMLAYPLLIGSLVAFLRVYEAAGFPMDGGRTLMILTAILSVAIAIPLLVPIAGADGSSIEKALNLAYPVLDLVLIVPAVLLARSTSRFRGGVVWKPWAALLSGMLFTCAADIVFAWFSVLGQSHLDPSVHALYVMAYAAVAAGVLYQQELLAA